MELDYGPHEDFMKNLYLVSAAIVAFASLSFADPTMELTGVGDSALFNNVYVDPYTATVNGVPNVMVLCDDWSNNTYFYETWQYKAINLSTVGTQGMPMFGNKQPLYTEEAWLASQLWANPTDYTTQVEVSFAMWDLTYGANGTYKDPTPPLTYMQNYLGAGYATNALYIGTMNLINEAPTASVGFNTQGWEILTPDLGTSNPAGDGLPQEFLTYAGVPEPSSWCGIFAFGLVGLLWAWRRPASAAPGTVRSR